MPEPISRFEDLPPAAQAKVETARAYRRTPEGQAELQRIIEAVEQEFPPLRPSARLMAALEELKAERLRLGLSLEELSQRTGIKVPTLTGLEKGRIPNPNVSTLEKYANALGRQFTLGLEPVGAGASPASGRTD